MQKSCIYKVKARQRRNPGESLRHTAVIGRQGQMGGCALPTYRLYRLDGAGRISGAEWLEAADDDEARSRARTEFSSGRYELWERYRLIERITREN